MRHTDAIRIRLRDLLHDRRLNRTELSEMTGITRATLHALYHENAKAISFDVLEKLCKALNCQPGNLLEYIPEGKQDE